MAGSKASSSAAVSACRHVSAAISATVQLSRVPFQFGLFPSDATANNAASTTRLRRGFRQQFFDDLFDMAGFQADTADDAFAVNNRIGGIVMHGPFLLGFQFGIAGSGVLDAVLLGVGHKFFLTNTVGADADDDQSLVLVFFQEFVVVGNGPHAGPTPGGVKVNDNDFALDVIGGNAAVDPIADVKGGHGFAFQGGVGGAIAGLGVPGPTVGKFARPNGQSAQNE